MSESMLDIRLFVAAYEQRSFTGAANREHATQSGVSQHIRKLEESYNVKLFFRENGRVVPTPAGDAYYARCIELLRLIEAGKNTIRSFSGSLTGEVNIGLMPTVTRATLAPTMQRIIAEHPNISVRVLEAYSPILTEAVNAGQLDFAIVPAFAIGSGLKGHFFLQTYEAFVARRDRNLHLKPVRLRDLGPLKLVMPSSANTRRSTLETYFATNAVDVSRMLEIDSMTGTLDFVRISDWVAVVPALVMASEIENDQFSVSPIVDPVASLDLVLIEPSRSSLSEAAAAVAGILKEEANRLNRLWQTHWRTS
jgi:DNA-binding transcriptional LysR family regulator